MNEQSTISLTQVTLQSVDNAALLAIGQRYGIQCVDALFCALITPVGREHLQRHLTLTDEQVETLIIECETLLGEEKTKAFRMAEPHYRKLGMLKRKVGEDDGHTDNT